MDGIENQTAATQTDPIDDLNAVIANYQSTTNTVEPTAPTTKVEPAAQTTEPITSAQEPAPVNNQAQQTPANAAFAQMRAENAKYKQLFEGYAKLNNVKDADVDSLLNDINNKVNEQEAKTLNVPPELLARMNQQQAIIDAMMQRDVANNLNAAFNTLKSEFSLEDTQALQFAQELRDQQFNLDDLSKLTTYYKGLHYDELVQSAVNKALADAAANKNYVAQHSATVATLAGNTDQNTTEDSASDTLAAINAGLAQLEK